MNALHTEQFVYGIEHVGAMRTALFISENDVMKCNQTYLI